MPQMLAGGAPLPFLSKGHFRMIVLRALKDHSMTGYDVIRSLEEKSHGMYKPSAGAVYPALRGLLKEGYVRVSVSDGKKTYRITSQGRAYLRTREEEIRKCVRSFEASVGPERAALLREMKKLGRLLAVTIRDMTPGQAREAEKVLVDARKRIGKILET